MTFSAFHTHTLAYISSNCLINIYSSLSVPALSLALLLPQLSYYKMSCTCTRTWPRGSPTWPELDTASARLEHTWPGNACHVTAPLPRMYCIALALSRQGYIAIALWEYSGQCRRVDVRSRDYLHPTRDTHQVTWHQLFNLIVRRLQRGRAGNLIASATAGRLSLSLSMCSPAAAHPVSYSYSCSSDGFVDVILRFSGYSLFCRCTETRLEFRAIIYLCYCEWYVQNSPCCHVSG